MKTFFDIFFLSRPILLIPVYAFIVFGYTNKITFSINQNLIIHTLLFSITMLAIHLSNRVNDYEVDKKNRGPGFIEITLSYKTMQTIIVITALLPFILLYILNLQNFIPIYLSATIIGFLYNYKPFYFTGKPFLDFLSNATGYGIVATTIGIMINQDNITILKILPYFLFMSAGAIASTTTDVEGDKKENKITTSIFLGIRNSLILGIIFLIINLIIGIKSSNLIIILNSIISIIGFVPAIIYPTNKKYLAYSYQIGGGFLILTAHILFPPLFLISIILLFITKIYYKLRFNINYPSLGK